MKIRRKRDNKAAAEAVKRENEIVEAAVARVFKELRKQNPTTMPRIPTVLVVQELARGLLETLNKDELRYLQDRCRARNLSLDDGLHAAGRAMLATWMDSGGEL